MLKGCQLQFESAMPKKESSDVERLKAKVQKHTI